MGWEGVRPQLGGTSLGGGGGFSYWQLHLGERGLQLEESSAGGGGKIYQGIQLAGISAKETASADAGVGLF